MCGPMQAAGDRYDIGTGRGPMNAPMDPGAFNNAPMPMFPPAAQAMPDRTAMDGMGAGAMPMPTPMPQQSPVRPRPAARPRGPLPTPPEMAIPPEVGIPQGGFPMPDEPALIDPNMGVPPHLHGLFPQHRPFRQRDGFNADEMPMRANRG
jgi:hypothetical protein